MASINDGGCLFQTFEATYRALRSAAENAGLLRGRRAVVMFS